MDSTPNLQLPYLIAAQSQKHVTHNEALRTLDAVAQLLVLDKDLASPPGSPTDGSRYIVAASPTGAWTGHAAHIAAWQDGAWMFYTPREGWLAWVADEDTIYVYDGAAWAAKLALLGINATADASNRLAVRSAASLLDNVGNGHQQKINKAAAGDTASTLYQTGYSGRAEYGLTGDDDFHVKVSPDGSTWHEALVVDKDDGTADLKKSLRAQDYLTGAQATGPRIVAVGDSHTVGSGATAPYTSLITYPTWHGQSFTVSNIGVGGRTVQDMSRLAYSNLNPLFANESGLNIAVVWGGINDITLGDTPENSFSYLSAFCRRLRGLGWRVVVCTLISRNGFNTERNLFNGYVRERWPSFADALVDLAANANIGADGAYTNATYFQAVGQTHLTDAGLTIVAGLVQTMLTTLAQGTANWFPPFGNAGVGTIVPTAAWAVSGNPTPPTPTAGTLLHIVSGDAATGLVSFDAFASVPGMHFRRANGTAASPSAVAADDYLGAIVGKGYGATGYSSASKADMGLKAAESWTDSAQGTYINWRVTPNGSTSVAEKMRLLGAGRLLVNTTTDDGVNALQINGGGAFAGPVGVKSYTVATLPSAATAGQSIYVSDETGGAVLAFADGTNWRRVTDRAVVA